MPRYAVNKSAPEVKARYFELIREGWDGSQAAFEVGVSTSCGSKWFVDAGSVSYIETPVSRRFFSQEDRIEIADALARNEPVKVIAERVGKAYQSVYREIARNRKEDGRYDPWFAHNQAPVRRRRERPRRFESNPDQLGGNFVIDAAGVLRYGRWATGPNDRPSVDALIHAANAAQS